MPVPISTEDFVAVGERFLSEDLIAEADRLLPLATADIALLATRGYGPGELEKLSDFRDTLVAESAVRRGQRGSKKGARLVLARAVKEGKLLLRSGETTALATLYRRSPPQGELQVETRRITTATVAQIDTLGGVIGSDSAKLRTRLTALITVLALPALEPAPDEAPARADLVAKIKAAIQALPALAEKKSTDQRDARTETSTLDELDGRTYTNLKMLTRVGRVYWKEHGNRRRAGEYQLNALHERAVKPPEPGEPSPDRRA